MKCAICVLIIAPPGQVRAQHSLTCNACEFVPVAPAISGHASPAAVLDGPGEFAGDPFADNNSRRFDLYGNPSLFDGLTGSGYILNNFGSRSEPGKGCCRLTSGQNDLQNNPVFWGYIIDNTTGCASDKFVTISMEAMQTPSVSSPLAVCRNSSAPTLTAGKGVKQVKIEKIRSYEL